MMMKKAKKYLKKKRKIFNFGQAKTLMDQSKRKKKIKLNNKKTNKIKLSKKRMLKNNCKTYHKKNKKS